MDIKREADEADRRETIVSIVVCLIVVIAVAIISVRHKAQDANQPVPVQTHP